MYIYNTKICIHIILKYAYILHEINMNVFYTKIFIHILMKYVFI